jgi:hypothetical protein
LEGTTASFSSLAFRFEQKLLLFIGRWVFSLITWPIQACLLAGCLSRQLVQQEDDARGKSLINIWIESTSTTIQLSFSGAGTYLQVLLLGLEAFWFPNDAQCLSYLLRGSRSYTSLQLNQCFGSVFIWYRYGSRSSVLGWIPIQIGFWWTKIEKMRRYLAANLFYLCVS